MKETSPIGAAAAAMHAAGGPASDQKAAGKMPTIHLGKLEVSRLILGSNPFFGFAHRGGDELAEAMKAYYTDERIMAVLDAAATLGVTAVAAPPFERWVRLFAEYLGRGGKLRTWIAQPDLEPADMPKAIAAAGEGGAKAVFIQGARAEDQFAAGNFDVLRRWLEQIRGFGLPAGLASHRPDAHGEYERRKLPTDFYFQCFFQPTNEQYVMAHRELAVAAIKAIEKPVVAYKVLAAGRIPAKEGFEFAFRHLRAKDGLCVGVYPNEKADMLDEDAGLTVELSRRA